ncbi:MAG: autotransporter-associated beta strand repeat-containing protein [Planctomycetia bacterium]|nr:autotransporter-associated beta strand repeat-containing protein [Planctomycetia bacterium]
MTLSSNLNFIGVAVIGRVFASSGKPWAPAKRSWISRAAILCAMLSWPSANCFAQYTWTAASNRTWDVTSANWTTGAGNIAWVDNNAAVLTSSGTGSITVAGTRTVTDFTAAGTYTLTGGTITMSGSTSALAIQSDTTTISSVLAGTVGLRKSGVGTLVLTSANTYNGTTTVNAGTLQVGDGGTSGSLGTGAIVNNGNLVYNRSTGSVALPNAGITGSGSLSLTSAGMLGTAFSDTGVLNIDTSAGNANVDLNVAIGVNAVNYSLAQLNVTSGTGVITISNTTGASWGVTSNAYIRQLTLSGRDVNVSANIPYFGRITVTNSGSNSTFSGTIGTTGSTGTVFTKAGDGLLIITANNTYAGDTAINAGTLQVGNGGTAGSLGSGAIANSGALVFSRSDSVTVASGISGTGSLTQSGSGSLILTGANTYSGTTTVSSGALQVGSGGTTGSLGTAAVVNNASLVFNRSNSVSVGNPISGAGSLTQSGSGSLILTGTNTYSGTTTVSSGTLQVGNGGTIGSIGTGAITNNGALVFNRSDSVTVASAISGAGSLEQRGAGSLILTGANTYSGTTTVSSGTLQVGNGGTTGSLGTNAIVNNGNLVFNRSTGSVAFPTAGIIGSGSLSGHAGNGL